MNAILAALVNGWIAGALVTAGVWLLLFLTPHRLLNAATRYLLWWITLAVAIALPVLYLPAPEWSAAEPAHPASPGGFGSVQQVTVLPALAEPTRKVPPPVTVTKEQSRPVPAPAPVQPPAASSAAPRAWPSFPFTISAGAWAGWVFSIWLITSLLLLIRLAVSWTLLSRQSARACDAPERLRAPAQEWLALRGTRIAISHEIAIPVAVGPTRPSILIPARILDALEEDELKQVVLHEAAHLARRDDYALIAQRIIEALFALHPVVRWIARRIDLEREIACDDLVIAATGTPRSYAACLTRIVELSEDAGASLPVAAAADGRSHLARRVDTLLDKTRHNGTRLLKKRFAAMAAVLTSVAWIAAKTPELVAFPAPPALSLKAASIIERILPAALAQAREAPPAEAQDLDGLVLDDASDAPLASAELRFHKAGQYELAADLETSRDGSVRVSGIGPGEYTVDVLKPNYVTATLRLRIPAKGPLVVRLVRYGAISGEVRNMQGQPVTGRQLLTSGQTGGRARICVLVRRPGTAELQSVRDVTPDDNGSYRIHDLLPGNYAVGLWYSGLRDGSGVQLYPDNVNPRFFSVAGGEEYTNTDFVISQRGAYQVSGRVALLKPGERFALALGLPEQPALPVGYAFTETDGSFRFQNVPPGSYDLFVSGPTRGYGAFDSMLDPEPLFGRARVQVSSQDVDGIEVAVSGGRSVAVVLRPHGSGQPAQGCPQSAKVTLRSLDPWGADVAKSTEAGFGREQTVRNLAPGRYRAVAADLGTACYQVNEPVVDLAGGAAAPVAVEVASAGFVNGTVRAGSSRPEDFVVVLLDSDSADNVQTRLALPEPDGRFRFEGLRPGRYRIAAQPAGAGSKKRWVADFARMREIQVPGGLPVDVELIAPSKGAR